MRVCCTRAEGMKEGVFSWVPQRPITLTQRVEERCGEDAHHLKKPDLHVCQLPGNTHSFYLYPDRFKPTQGPSVAKGGAQLFFRGRGPESTIIETDNVNVDYILDTILFSF